MIDFLAFENSILTSQSLLSYVNLHNVKLFFEMILRFVKILKASKRNIQNNKLVLVAISVLIDELFKLCSPQL